MLTGEALLNPIEREKLALLRKWVSENTADTAPLNPVSPDPTGATPTTAQASNSDSLLDRIFDQYARGDDIAASWKVTLQSPAFKPIGSRQGGR
jgi:hypothetical protein